GSRGGEVRRIGPVFAATVAGVLAAKPGLQVIIPAATPALADRLRAQFAAVDVRVLDGQSRTAMAAADALLLASGTAALEGALVGRPMVVGYRLNRLTGWWVRRLLKVKHVALPNHLTAQPHVPEFLLERCRPELLMPAVQSALDDDDQQAMTAFAEIHRTLATNAAARAANAVTALLARVASIQ
ncbi:MAG: lipid-A-disaccharide synthase, partial [Litorivicinus sp.]